MPHHTLAYSTKTSAPHEPKELFGHSSLPVPIFSVNFKVGDLKDPAAALLQKKRDYTAKLTSLKQSCRLQHRLKGDFIQEKMKDYIELMESDPAPLINSEFDWHCCGGNLDVVKINDENLLVQPSMCKEFEIRLLDTSSHLEVVNLHTKSKWLNKNYGYEILSSKAFFGVRHKNVVNFAARKDSCSQQLRAPIEFKWNFEIAASHLNRNHLLFIDVKNCLVRTNVARKVAVDRIELPAVDQLPFSIGSVDKNVISYTDQKSFRLVDFRDGEVNRVFDHKKFLIKCEEISYHKNSLQDNLVFLASSHVLYGIDYRQPKGLLVHWTHQLVHQPAMMKTVMLNDDEVICLSSNSPGDLKVFNYSKGASVSRQPVKPRSALQSFNQMRERGRLLLSDHIRDRVRISTTGIAMIANKQKSSVGLFTQNALGDVFKSKLCCEPSDDKDERLEKNFDAFDKALAVSRDANKYLSVKERAKQEELQFNNVVQMKGLTRVFRCEKLRNDDDVDVTRMKTTRAPKWKIDLEDAMDYRDALSQHLLAEWELELEETQPQLFAEALKESGKTEKGADKVSRWLEATATGEPAAMEEQDAPPIEETFTQELPMTQKTIASAKPKKLTQRVKGF